MTTTALGSDALQIDLVLEEALDRACRALRFAFPDGVDAGTQARLMGSILRAASRGERSPAGLSACALGQLPAFPATRAKSHFH
jgi:hypothetical protein